MNRAFFPALLLALALAATACGAPQREIQMPLTWRTTDDVHDVPAAGIAAFAGQTVTVIAFQDQRQKREQIGANREQGRPRAVLTNDDVGTYVARQLAEVLRQNGVTVVPSGGTRTLQGEVLQFFVDESNTYDADVSARISLLDGNGVALWAGVMTGHAKRFGHSFDPANYEEAFSNALLDAVKMLLGDGGFQAAVRGGPAAP